VRNLTLLNRLLRYFADTIGKLTSINNISKFMKSQGVDIAVKSISSYLSYYKDAYLLYTVERFDIRGKRILESNEKIYFGDLGLRNLFQVEREKVI
jgi:predicted AAA+ superfamily ATPase